MIAWDVEAGCSLMRSFLKYLGVPGAIFGDAFEVLEVPEGALGGLWETFGSPGESLGGSRSIFHRSHFEGLGAPFVYTNHGLGNDFSIHASRIVFGGILLDLWLSKGPPRT